MTPDLPMRWRDRLTLPGDVDQADLNDLVDGCGCLGTDNDRCDDWSPDSVVRRCDELAALCLADARDRRRFADFTSRRAADLRRIVDTVERLSRKGSHAVLLLEGGLADAARLRPPTAADRPLFDPLFGAVDVVGSLRDELADLVRYWSTELTHLEATLPTLVEDADLADERVTCLRAVGRARAMFLAIGPDR